MFRKITTISFTLCLALGLFLSAKVLAVDHNVSGYAWSERIGWISFNCANNNHCAASSYGVDIDSNGNFSGYAWSEYIGWISFNSADVAACGTSAKVNFANGEVSGWARILNPGEGLSGCVKMQHTNYGVTINLANGDFAGYAWSEDFGWIRFAGNKYKVTTNLVMTPTITSVSAEYTTPCAQSRIPKVSWVTNASKPYDYKISFCSDISCNDVLFSETKYNSYDTEWMPSCVLLCDVGDYTKIDFGNKGYYVGVSARNIGGEWSGNTITRFGTKNNAYPWVNFTCNDGDCAGAGVHESREVILSSTSVYYTEGASCLWTLPEGITEIIEGEVTDCEIKVMFSSPPPNERNQNITLTVTDDSDYTCSKTKNINIRYPLPEYKETSPVVFIRNILVGWLNRAANLFAGF